MNKKHFNLNKEQKFIWGGILVVIIFTFLIAPVFRNEVNKNVATHTSTLRDDIKLTLPRGEIEVQLADSETSRELGLSYRESIGDEEGMLFIFDKPDVYAFWMKDMKFPIDIIWLSETGQVVHTEEDVSPNTYPKIFANKPKAQYVLELNAGMAKKYGLYLGSKVLFPKVK